MSNNTKDKEFWDGIENSYRNLGYIAIGLAIIAAVSNFLSPLFTA